MAVENQNSWAESGEDHGRAEHEADYVKHLDCGSKYIPIFMFGTVTCFSNRMSKSFETFRVLSSSFEKLPKEIQKIGEPLVVLYLG